MGVGEFELPLVLVELSEQVASRQQVGVDADRGFQGVDGGSQIALLEQAECSQFPIRGTSAEPGQLVEMHECLFGLFAAVVVTGECEQCIESGFDVQSRLFESDSGIADGSERFFLEQELSECGVDVGVAQSVLLRLQEQFQRLVPQPVRFGSGCDSQFEDSSQVSESQRSRLVGL